MNISCTIKDRKFCVSVFTDLNVFVQFFGTSFSKSVVVFVSLDRYWLKFSYAHTKTVGTCTETLK